MAVIQEDLSKEYIRLIDDEREPGKGWYLLHFPIVKPSSTTIKHGLCSMHRQKLNVCHEMMPFTRGQNSREISSKFW